MGWRHVMSVSATVRQTQGTHKRHYIFAGPWFRLMFTVTLELTVHDSNMFGTLRAHVPQHSMIGFGKLLVVCGWGLTTWVAVVYSCTWVCCASILSVQRVPLTEAGRIQIRQRNWRNKLNLTNFLEIKKMVWLILRPKTRESHEEILCCPIYRQIPRCLSPTLNSRSEPWPEVGGMHLLTHPCLCAGVLAGPEKHCGRHWTH